MASVAIALYAEWPVGVVYLLAAVNATVLTVSRVPSPRTRPQH
jgi:hypothetical protein